MNRTVKFFILLASILTTSNKILAQSNTKILQEQIENAEIVVEGYIITQKGYIEQETGKIRTANYLKIETNFKGFEGDEIVIHTNGGEVDGTIIEHSHGIKLNNGLKGIFLIESENKSQKHIISNGNLGIIQYLKNDKAFEAFYIGTSEKLPSWRKLKEQIGLFCNKDISIPLITNTSEIFASISGTELCVRLANPMPLFQTSQVEFDLMVKSNVQGLGFSSAEIHLNYPTEQLGSNIVFNNGITATKSTVIADPIYSLNLYDVNEDKLKIVVSTGCPTIGNYYTLDTIYEKLGHVIVDVIDWGNIGTINLEDFAVDGGAEFYNGLGECERFEELCGEGQVGFVACNIQDVEVAPFAAGKGQIITISGSEFGNGILGQIDIPNPDDGGGTDFSIFGIEHYVVSWQDDEIQMKVSSEGPNDHPMGSGTWWINPDFTQGIILSCPVEIEVDYALLNTHVEEEDRMIGLAKVPNANNPDGAYEWYIDGGINADPILQGQGITFELVEEVAMEAFCDWENAAGIEIRYMGALANPDNDNDNRNAIFFSDNLDDDAAADTRINFSVDLCDNDFLYFAGRIIETDIRFDRGSQWFVSTNDNGIQDLQFDFYSILLHEIGHSLGLKHAMDTEDNNEDDTRLMYYRVRDEQIKRNIDNNSEAGVELIIQRTQESINTQNECFNGFALNTNPVGCAPNAVININPNECKLDVKNLIQKGEPIEIDFNEGIDKRITLFTLIGQPILFIRNAESGRSEIDTSNLPSGIYFLQYFCDDSNTPLTEKIIIH